jgi:hypothetical protein
MPLGGCDAAASLRFVRNPAAVLRLAQSKDQRRSASRLFGKIFASMIADQSANN